MQCNGTVTVRCLYIKYNEEKLHSRATEVETTVLRTFIHAPHKNLKIQFSPKCSQKSNIKYRLYFTVEQCVQLSL